MWNRDLLSGFFLFLLSTGTCVMSYRLGMGSGSSPGPGFIPFGIAALLGLMSLYLCLQGVIQALKGSGERPSLGRACWKAMLVLAILVAYGSSFNSLGFALATFVLLMLLLWPIGRQTLTLSLTVSCLTVLCSHVVFVVLLQLPLPQGVLGQWFR